MPGGKIAIALMMPFPLWISFLYVPGYLIVRRDRTPFIGKGGILYWAVRVAVMAFGLALSLVFGAFGAVGVLFHVFGAVGALKHVPDIFPFVDMILLPFTVSAILYFSLRLFFWFWGDTMRNYLDYGAILYYVSIAILAAYGYVLFDILLERWR